MLTPHSASIEFGWFKIEPHRRELLVDGEPIKLGGRTFDPLMAQHCHGNCIEHALRAKARHESFRCDRILPHCSRFGSEDPQGGSGDEVALKVEGVVDRTVHAEEALDRSS